jgi:hypothetical protein
MIFRIIAVSMAITLSILVGCGKDDAPTDFNHLEVHLWQIFQDDMVVVELDKAEIFVGIVTTDQILTLAQRIETSAVHGEHTLTVIVNDHWMESVRFVFNGPLFIGVSFFRNYIERPFEFQFLEEEPVYH